MKITLFVKLNYLWQSRKLVTAAPQMGYSSPQNPDSGFKMVSSIKR
jgi:hypothetical protein